MSSSLIEFFSILSYSLLVLLVGYFSFSKKMSNTEFILGGRSLNYWITALAAHASEMGSWLFLAFPSMIYTFGFSKIWIAVGLIVCMYLNWHFIASKVRIASEKTQSLTFFSYLGNRFQDHTGHWRFIASILCFVFYIIYISVGLMTLGIVIESLFDIQYSTSIFISMVIAIPYVLIGGYRTLAWIDLFQGLFLMFVIVAVPLYLLGDIGGLNGIQAAAAIRKISLEWHPDFSIQSIFEPIFVMLGWGLGYFGQPTIITKFMGIRDPEEIFKSKIIGMTWMIISLSAAILVGLVGIAFFKNGIDNSEMIFIEMVKQSFHPFLIGFILCAVFAASINVMSSQMLVLCSSFTEDIFQKIFPRIKNQILISRLSCIGIGIIAYVIAYFKFNSIYSLVLYAWSGLGASFGPLLIYSLYSNRTHPLIAWAAILSGAISILIWPWMQNDLVPFAVDPIIIGFICSFGSIFFVSTIVEDPKVSVLK